MQKILLFFLLVSAIYAQKIALKLNVESLDFTNSKQKKDGMVYGALIGYEANYNDFKIYAERTNTNTYQPPLPDDLSIYPSIGSMVI